jgi:hypothetical protein
MIHIDTHVQASCAAKRSWVSGVECCGIGHLVSSVAGDAAVAESAEIVGRAVMVSVLDR